MDVFGRSSAAAAGREVARHLQCAVGKCEGSVRTREPAVQRSFGGSSRVSAFAGARRSSGVPVDDFVDGLFSGAAGVGNSPENRRLRLAVKRRNSCMGAYVRSPQELRQSTRAKVHRNPVDTQSVCHGTTGSNPSCRRRSHLPQFLREVQCHDLHRLRLIAFLRKRENVSPP